MNRRNLVGTMVMAASLFGGVAVYAQPASFSVPVHAIFSKSKMVSFTIKNESSETMHLMAAGNAMTLDAGKSVNVKLADGEKVTATETTAHYQAGSVIVVASSAIADASIVLR